jgi:hypothetical protein
LLSAVKHVVVLGQLIESMDSAIPEVSGTQLDPPSVVRSIVPPLPTAKQVDSVGQLIAKRVWENPVAC